MASYILKPKSVRKSQILEKEFSLSGFAFRYVNHKNQNYQLLGDEQILAKNIKGFEPGSKGYIDFSENYFVRISEMDDLGFSFDVKKDTKKIRPVVNENKNRYIVKGDICYQTASNVGNVCFYNGKKAFYNSHIRKLELKKDKYYIFAVLKSKFGKEQVDVTGSIKGVDNFREEYLLNTKISFPTTKNNPSPENIEKLVSVIVQNIIDKEEQIRAKNKLIDEKIEQELRENQKENSFSYVYPKINEIKEAGRLDTGLYERDFKETDFLIRNYEGGYFQIPFEKFKSGSTPKVRILNPMQKNYKWVTPTHISDEGFYEPVLSIIMPTKKNISKDCILIINRTSKGKQGEYVGISCFYDFSLYGKGQHNQGLYQVRDFNKVESLFLVSLLNSKTLRKICGCVSIGSKMKEMKASDFAGLKFPNFPESKQKEIAKVYYNRLDKNNDLTFEDYLEKEKVRNKEIGIFQLNMEIFRLREILEDLVHKIVMEEKIEITLDY